MKKVDVFLATSSAGKVRQIKEACLFYYMERHGTNVIPYRFHTVTPKRDLHVVEDSQTLTGNAYKKAEAYGDRYQMWTIADDSGLFVTALNGRPGLHSHRDGWNAQKVVQVLEHTTDRRAYLMTVGVLHCPNCPKSYYSTQRMQWGKVVDLPSDLESGYGYDSIFVPDTSQQMTVVDALRSGKNRADLEYPRTMAMMELFAILHLEAAM